MDPVIIAGAGPVGLALALSLARLDVPVVVIDEGPGQDERRLARTVVLRPDTAALLRRLGCETAGVGRQWSAWRTFRRRQLVQRVPLTPAPGQGGPGGAVALRPDGATAARPERAPGAEDPARGEAARSERDPARSGGPEPGEVPADEAAASSPLHLPQHELTCALRAALASLGGENLVRIVPGTKLDTLEQDPRGVSIRTRGAQATWWRGSFLVGCDGARSTVRKLLGVRFAGRTAVERHAVAALRADLPWPGEGVLHRSPPWRSADGEVTAQPLPHGLWRLDWLLPPGRELVTPEALLARVNDTLAGWCGEEARPYELLDTGVYTVHHRLARRWRVDRAFLAGDAAHLLGALGTQGLDEGLRDVANLAWKLGLAWHHGASDTLLDSYQAERRAAVGTRLRAADQALPVVRGEGSWQAVRRAVVPGTVKGHDALLTDARTGRGPLGEPPAHPRSPLSPPAPPAGSVTLGTPPGSLVEDVPVTAPDGSAVRLWERLGGRMLVVLVAPGTGVWDRRHWLGAGLMPRLASAVSALPVRAELLVAEEYPEAPAHTVLLVRPDGHLVAALSGVRPAELYAAAEAARGGGIARRDGGGGSSSVGAEATAHG